MIKNKNKLLRCTNKRPRDRLVFSAALVVLMVLMASCTSAVSDEVGSESVPDGTQVVPTETPPQDGDANGDQDGDAAQETPPPPTAAGGSSPSTGDTSTTEVSNGGESDEAGGSSGKAILEEIFSEEELENLKEVFSEEELAEMAETFTEADLRNFLASYAEELEPPTEDEIAARWEELLGEEGLEDMRQNAIAVIYEGQDYEGYSDEYVLAAAYRDRAFLDDDPLGIDLNDRSTPLGAFCWAVSQVFWAAVFATDATAAGNSFLGVKTTDRPVPFVSLQHLWLWHVEQEVARRGLDLWWVTGPADFQPSLLRTLQNVTAPEFRDVVFASDLPPQLRPVAEEMYGHFTEWLNWPVQSVRPTVEEISGYRGLEEITEEQISQIWREESEIVLTENDYMEFAAAVGLLAEEEIRDLLDAGCRGRSYVELQKRTCPTWVTEASASARSACEEEEDEDIAQCSMALPWVCDVPGLTPLGDVDFSQE